MKGPFLAFRDMKGPFLALGERFGPLILGRVRHFRNTG